jgi:transcriptional regulator with XRE-family HTH domain
MANQAQSEVNAAIAARLRLIRLAYGIIQRREKPMSQAEFSRFCDIGAPAWNHAETGDNRLGIDAATSVARRTGVTLDYIYLGNLNGVPHVLAIEIEMIDKAGARGKMARRG